MKIYLAHPISGLSYDEIDAYYRKVTSELSEYEILCPMTGKSYLRNETKLKAHAYSQPLSTNNAILMRDFWMVSVSDVIFVNLMGSDAISIGCVCELAFAWVLKKHIVVAMEKDNIHMHAFVIQMSGVLYESYEDAVLYLKDLVAPYGSSDRR